MNPMNQHPFSSMAPPPWPPPLPAFPPPSSAFWNADNVRGRLKELQDTLNLAIAMKKELEALNKLKDGKGSRDGMGMGSCEASVDKLAKFMELHKINLENQESLSLEAANAMISKLRVQLEPFRAVVDENCPWEEKSAAARLVNKMQKYKRNKLWRKRKRKRVAEKNAEEREQFEQVDKDADEWRAREIANDAAKHKVEKMKQIAKQKAKEERKKLESELELALMVEKLQELRSMRIQKMKKQGHFLPEEDDKFLERVRAAVEEEERQAMAAVGTHAAKDAIATAEESRQNIQNDGSGFEEPHDKTGEVENQEQMAEVKVGASSVTNKELRNQESGKPSSNNAYGSMANLPMEFYHYYYGSNTDMGTLIEVRRTWDAYIRPGGSRIPGHWIQPPPPSDEIWASYLVKPK